MKLLDRYLIREFFKPFIGCVFIFCLLVLLGRYFDKLDMFNSFHARARDVVLCLLLGLPFWLNLVLPVATLLAVMLSIGKLQQQGEITAFRSAGVTSLRLYAPLLICGFLIAVLSLVSGLSFIPKINSISSRIYRVNIKHQVLSNSQRDHIVATGQDHRRYTIGWLDVDKNLAKDLVVDRFNDTGLLVETLSAKDATYEQGSWHLLNANLIHYDPLLPDGYRQKAFPNLMIHLPEKPGDFIFEDKRPDDMTGGELFRRIRHLRRLGADTHHEQVALHMKIALPFAHVIVILLGIPFAIKSGQKARVQAFAWALGLTFFYWGTTSVCQSLGEQGRIPAWIAAWFANMAFGSVALWRLIE